MKALQANEWVEHVNRELANETRWNSSLDKDLLISCLSNASLMVYAQGIAVREPEPMFIHDTDCVITVLYNPYVVKAQGCSVAVCLTDTVNQIVIFVDDRFMVLSPDTQAFTIHHELGHIVNLDMSERGTRNMDYELAADMYAANKTSTDIAVKALIELKGLFCGSEYEASANELSERINAMIK